MRNSYGGSLSVSGGAVGGSIAIGAVIANNNIGTDSKRHTVRAYIGSDGNVSDTTTVDTKVAISLTANSKPTLDTIAVAASAAGAASAVGGAFSGSGASINNNFKTTTTAAIQNGQNYPANSSNNTVKATGAITLNATETPNITSKVGSGSGVAALVGASIGVSQIRTTIDSDTKAFIDEVKIKSDSGLSKVNASSNATVNDLSVATSIAASIGGAGAGADAKAVTNARVNAYIGSTANVNAYDLEIKAVSNENLKTETYGLSAGMISVGAAIAHATNNAQANAYINGNVTTTNNVTVQAEGKGTTEAKVTAIAGGMIGTASGNNATARFNANVNAYVGTGAQLDIGKTVNVNATVTPKAISNAFGISVDGFGASVGVSESFTYVNPRVNAYINTGSSGSLKADKLIVLAQQTQSGTSESGKANAQASGGGLMAGITASIAKTENTAQINAYVGNNSTLKVDGTIDIKANSLSKQRTNTSGVSVAGILAVGANVATTTSNITTNAYLGTGVNISNKAGSAKAGNFNLQAIGNDDSYTEATAGGGGVVSGRGAEARTNSTSNTTVNLGSGNIKVSNAVVKADNTSKFNSKTNSINASVAGGSGAAAYNTVNANAITTFGSNLTFTADNLTANAFNTISKPQVSGVNAQAGSGGVLDGSAVLSHTDITNRTKVIVNDRATLNAVDTNGLIKLGAKNNLNIVDRTKLDTGGVITGAVAESIIRNNTNEAIVEIGNATLNSSRDIDLYAYGVTSLDVKAESKTYGLAGIADGISLVQTNITNNVILKSGSTLDATRDVNLFAGRASVTDTGLTNFFNDVNLKADTVLFNGTVFTGIAPNATSNLTLNNKVLINSGATIQTARDINLKAVEGTKSVNALGIGRSLASETIGKAANAISNFFGGGDVSFEVRGGSTTNNIDSGVVADGTLVAGDTNQVSIRINADNTSSVNTNAVNGSTLYAPKLINRDLATSLNTRLTQINSRLTKINSQDKSAATIQVEIQNLNEEKASIEFMLESFGLTAGNAGSQVELWSIPDITVSSGNINVSGDYLVGTGSLTARGDNEITIINDSSRNLLVNDLIVQDGNGGQITFNDGGISAASDLNFRNRNTNQNANFSSFNTASSQSSSITVRNTIANNAPLLLSEQNKKILNPLGSITLDNPGGSIGVQGDIQGQNINITAGENFFLNEGYRYSVSGNTEAELVRKNEGLLFNRVLPNGGDIAYDSFTLSGNYDDIIPRILNGVVPASNVATYNGSLYLMSDGPTTLETAFLLITQNARFNNNVLFGTDAYLVTINNQAEQDFLTQNFGGSGNTFWIGLNDLYAGEGNYEWASGQNSSYRNWAPGEPSNSSNENGVIFNWGGAGLWSDTNVNQLHHYILEIPYNTLEDIYTNPNANFNLGFSNNLNTTPGQLIADGNIFINSEHIDVNGLIRSGTEEYQVTLNGNVQLNREIQAHEDNYAANPSINAKLDIARHFTNEIPENFSVSYNALTNSIEIDSIGAKGGLVQLIGKVSSTGNGKIEVLDGFTDITIDNQTGYALTVNQLDTGGDGTKGKVIITDKYKQQNGQLLTDVKTQVPLTTTITSSKGRLTSYQPLNNLTYSFQNYGDVKTYRATSNTVVGEVRSDLTPSYSSTINLIDSVASTKTSVFSTKVDSNLTSNYEFKAEGTRLSQSGLDFTIEEVFTHKLKADKTINIEFLGNSTGTVNITSIGDVILNDSLINRVGTTNITSTAGFITQTSGKTIEAQNLNLNAKKGIGTENQAIQSNLSGSKVQAITSDSNIRDLKVGGIYINQVTGNIEIANLQSGGKVKLNANGNITAANNNAVITAPNIEITSRSGGIGSNTQSFGINSGNGFREFVNAPSTDGVTVSAATNIYLEEKTDDLYLVSATSSAGNVEIKVPNGSIIDHNLSETEDQTAINNLIQAAKQELRLTAATGAQTAINEQIASYERSKVQNYQRYWQYRNIAQNPDGTYSADAYDAGYQFTFDSLTRTQLEDAGQTSAQITAEETRKTNDYHALHQSLDTAGLTTTYNSNYSYSADVTEISNLSDGGLWSEQALNLAISPGLLLPVSDTNTRIEVDNVKGANITLDAGSAIGKNLASTTITQSQVSSNGFTQDQLVALVSAERSDLTYYDFGFSVISDLENSNQAIAYIEINSVDDVNLTATGKVKADANSHIYLGSEADIKLDTVNAPNQEVRIKTSQGIITEQVTNYVALTGTNDSVTIPHDPSLNLNGQFTIETWINPSQIKSDFQPIIAKTDSNSSSRNFGLFIVPNTRKIHYSVFDASGTNYHRNSLGDLTLNQWNHVALVLSNDGVMRLYINGVEDSSRSGVPTSLFQNTEPVKIGDEVNVFDTFTGQIADVRIWNTARSSTEIANNLNTTFSGTEAGLQGYYLFDNGATDRTRNSNNGTLNNSAAVNTSATREIIAGNLVLEAGSKSIGSNIAPININVSSLVARAGKDVNISTNSALNVNTVFAANNAKLTAQGNILDNQNNSNVNIRSQAVDLNAIGGDIGTSSNPLEIDAGVFNLNANNSNFNLATDLTTFVVDTLEDTVDNDLRVGDRSLREALEYANNFNINTITFAPSLSGQTININGSELVINKSLTIDGDLNNDGVGDITLDAGNNSRVFRIDDGTNSNLDVTVDGLTISGGGINNLENLTLQNSIVQNNLSVGIENQGTLNVTNSLFLNNSGINGGAIANNAGATATITQSIFGNNSATSNGGAIYNLGSLTLLHNTISNNNKGIYNSGTVNLKHNIIANSTAGADVVNTGTVNVTGSNLVEDGSLTHAQIINLDPNLSPLRDNGGGINTYIPLAGSPVANISTDASGLTTDIRGLTRTVAGLVDLGAVESNILDITVDTVADVDNGNFSVGDRSLREVLSLIPDGGTVLFAPSLNNQTITLAGTELLINKSIALNAANQNITIDGNNQSRVFNIDNSSSSLIDVTLDGLTITKGSNGLGAGIQNNENLTIRNSNITNSNGAGIYTNTALILENTNISGNTWGIFANSNTGNVAIDNSNLTNNTTDGIFIQGSAQVDITNSNISQNQDDGIEITSSATLNILNSQIKNNQRRAIALRNSSGTLNLTGSTIDSNQGGIYSFGDTTVTNSTISNNQLTVGNAVSGIFATGNLSVIGSTISGNLYGIRSEGDLNVLNSTIAYNTGSNLGGIFSRGNATIRSSVIVGNQDSSGTGNEIDNQGGLISSHNLIGDASQTNAQAFVGFTPSGTDITATSDGTNPTAIGNILLPLANNGGTTQTHALVPGSPAIDAGSNLNNLTTDQTGAARVSRNQIDIGAVESQPLLEVRAIAINENLNTNSPVKVADITILDSNFNSSQLSLTGAMANRFELGGSNGTEIFLKAGETIDYETETSISLTVNLDDTTVGGTPDDFVSLVIPINDVNEAVTGLDITNAITLFDNLDTTERVKVADLIITDDALGTNNLVITGVDAGLFEIDNQQLFIQAGKTLSSVTNPQLDITIQVDDPALAGNPDFSKSFAFTVFAVPSDIVVDTLEDINNGNLSPGDISLREALSNVQFGGTITFAPSLSGQTINLNSELLIDNTITIDGDLNDDGIADITLDGGGQTRAFNIDDRNNNNQIDVNLQGVKISNSAGIYNRENLTLDSVNYSNNDGINVGAKVLTLDGTDDYVRLGSASTHGLTNNSFTVEAKIKIDQFNGGDETILGTDATFYNNGLHLVVRNRRPYMGFYANDTDSSATLNAGQWYDVTWVYDQQAQTQSIYLDGVLVGQGTGKPAFQGTGDLLIGRWASGQYFNGDIDDLRIWNKALNQTEIELYRSQNLAGNEANLVALYNFNDGTASDRTANNPNGSLQGNAAIQDAENISNGAIINEAQGNLVINNSTLDDNSSVNFGGAINNQGGNVTITNSTLSNNSSATGGAIYNTGSLNITQSTVSSNSASSSGGGTYLINGTPGQTIKLNLKGKLEKAGYAHEIGLLIVDDDQGSINGVNHGDVNYAQTALTSARRQILFTKEQATGAHQSLTLDAGDRLVFYMVKNNTSSHWLQENPDNHPHSETVVFFSAFSNPLMSKSGQNLISRWLKRRGLVDND